MSWITFDNKNIKCCKTFFVVTEEGAKNYIIFPQQVFIGESNICKKQWAITCPLDAINGK